MGSLNKDSDRINLKTRYLIWLYKTAKEELDRIDRKFTQPEVDKFIYDELNSSLNAVSNAQKALYKKLLDEFSNYIKNKENGAFQLKFEKSSVERPHYIFLKNKINAIEKAIIKFHGRGKLNQIKLLYHQEMIKRIWEEKQHK